MIIRPTGNKVLLEPIKSDKVTSTGIVLKYSVEPDLGKVIAVGPDVREVFSGNTVYLDWNQCEKIEGEDLWIIKEDHIIFVKED